MRRKPPPEGTQEDLQAAGTGAWKKTTFADQAWMQRGDLRFNQEKLAECNNGTCDGGHTCQKNALLLKMTPRGKHAPAAHLRSVPIMFEHIRRGERNCCIHEG